MLKKIVITLWNKNPRLRNLGVRFSICVREVFDTDFLQNRSCASYLWKLQVIAKIVNEERFKKNVI